MKKIDKAISKLINSLMDKFAGNGVMQEENSASGGSCAAKGIAELIRRAGADGAVLLKNDGVLPVTGRVSVFGRCQFDWFYVGYGSGGDVHTSYRVNLTDGLRRSGRAEVNEELAAIYDEWRSREENRADHGWWGHWPFNFDEMPLSDDIVARAANVSESAVVVIGRAAGEDRENKLEKGSYYLTDAETDMLDKVTAHFSRVAVVLDCGNVIDIEWTLRYKDKIGAIVYAWQTGQESGSSAADVLTGAVNPSGKLTDSIAVRYEDYPSSRDFGGKEYNFYREDIFVGYRYFETFAPEKVLYPFGFGLSYSSFDISCASFKYDGNMFEVEARVRNTSDIPGREVVQLYVQAPQGRLKKARRVLVAFAKTGTIGAGKEETVKLSFDRYLMSSYDDQGVTGNKSCYVLEEGLYKFYLGSDVRAALLAGEYEKDRTEVLVRLDSVCAVKHEFDALSVEEKDGRLLPGKRRVSRGVSKAAERAANNAPRDIMRTGDRGIKLVDVKEGRYTLDAFIAQLTDEELEALTRGEGGMGSPLGTEGNAGAFGGVIESLRSKGVPPVICTDGPSGIRIRRYVSLLPCGTALACTWDEALVEELYAKVCEELNINGSDVLLSPGMNIHRSPLCGRNFEYFSEDPLLAGRIAAAEVRGIQSDGRKSACPKHFACNNQEVNRVRNDSRISERALREIYLKPFEICVKESAPHNIMTSYNKINGVWSYYNYDLVTTVLRGEWGYRGNVMTDWWIRKGGVEEFPMLKTNACRVRAQTDVLMPGNMSHLRRDYRSDGTLLPTLGREGGITLGELQRTAANVLKAAMLKL